MAASKKRPTLIELVEWGHLAVGEKLTCTPSSGGRTHTALLDEYGHIRFGDESYRTPSGWAKALAGGSRNGWTYVQRARDSRTLASVYDDALKERRVDARTVRTGTGESTTGTGESTTGTGESTTGTGESTTGTGESTTGTGESTKSARDPALRATPWETGVGHSELMDRILELSPGDFEQLVGEFLRARGFEDVEVTGRSNDGGIDGHCSMHFVKIRVAFQAKRWRNNVPIEPVQRLVGSISDEFDRGILVTTSGFTPAAKAWMEEKSRPIVLIDGKQFVQQLIDLSLGVKKIPVVRLAMDEGFFGSLS